MNVKDRNDIKNIIKVKIKKYLKDSNLEENINVVKRFKKLKKLFTDYLRKENSSNNSIKMIPKIARLIFGLNEDFIRLKLLKYDFSYELEIINDRIIEMIEARRNTMYLKKCNSYGETLLNIYLDIFIFLTVYKDVEIEKNINPSFLRYPLTGSNLELDVLIEEIKLAFEFQGEHHYFDTKVINKDAFKMNETFANKRILVPVNIYQLNSTKLSNLIINTIKDYLDLGLVMEDKTKRSLDNNKYDRKAMAVFFKITQRILLATTLFEKALKYLDMKAKKYISEQNIKSIVSSNTDAPRYKKTRDLGIRSIYRTLPRLNRILKNKVIKKSKEF